MLMRVCLAIAGFINFAPVMGLASAEALSRLYGIPTLDGDLLVLMRHRALLFGILGGFMLVAVFRPRWQWLAMVGGGVSMVGFILVAWDTGGYTEAIDKVIRIDLGALVALAAAAGLRWHLDRSNMGEDHV